MAGVLFAHVGRICLVDIDAIIAVGGSLQELGLCHGSGFSQIFVQGWSVEMGEMGTLFE